MKEFSGKQDFPIWLVGDSPPQNWEKDLNHPLDERHPTRHSIWTPIESAIQKYLYDWGNLRFSTENMYIINALSSLDVKKPESSKEWEDEGIKSRQNVLKSEIEIYKGINLSILLTLGSFSFEMTRRALGIGKPRSSYWTFKLLGEKFRESYNSFNKYKINIFPLLHASIARKNFLKAHKDYCSSNEDSESNNYFYYVGYHLATILYENYSNNNEVLIGPAAIKTQE